MRHDKIIVIATTIIATLFAIDFYQRQTYQQIQDELRKELQKRYELQQLERGKKPYSQYDNYDDQPAYEFERIKEFILDQEGNTLHTYLDTDHSNRACGGVRIKRKIKTLTNEQCDWLNNRAIQRTISEVELLYPHLANNQKVAVVSIIYNLGLFKFAKTKLFIALKSTNHQAICYYFQHDWKNQDRRQAEAVVFGCGGEYV